MTDYLQVLYDLSKTELYDDVLVADIDTFVQDLSYNPAKIDLLNRITTLRVYETESGVNMDPNYIQLMQLGEWSFCGLKTGPEDCWAGMRKATSNRESAKRFLHVAAYAAIRSSTVNAILGSQEPLYNVKRVIMTGAPGTFPWGFHQAEFDWFDQGFGPGPIPLLFLDLPNIKHYCQCRHTGPLALPNQVIAVDNPPEIVTFHPQKMLVEWGPQWSPPIVIGATNRYMCNGNAGVASRTDTGEDLPYDHIAYLMAPLHAMLQDRPVMHINARGHQQSSLSSVSLADTRIEVYDYIRHTNLTKAIDDDLPSDIGHIQSMFNAELGQWKGKVFLKNREDCPPCSACGFEGLWKDDKKKR